MFCTLSPSTIVRKARHEIYDIYTHTNLWTILMHTAEMADDIPLCIYDSPIVAYIFVQQQSPFWENIARARMLLPQYGPAKIVSLPWARLVKGYSNITQITRKKKQSKKTHTVI